MPAEKGYEAQIMPRAGAPLPLSNPGTFGAGVGDAMANIGQDMHRREIREYQIQRQLTADRETADFAARYAVHRQAMDDAVRAMRTDPSSPDYADHVQRVRDLDEKAREQLLGGITEDSVRQRAALQLEDYRVRLVDQESTFAEGQRVAKTVLDADKVLQLGANRVRRAETGQQWADELKDWYGFVDGLQGLTPNDKTKLRRQGEQTYSIAFANHLNDTNPQAAVALIDAGTFDDFLDPQQLDQLRAGSMVEMRRVQAQAAHQMNVAAAQVREQIATVEEKARQGIDVSAELPALIEQAGQLGDASTVTKLRGLQRESQFARVWGAVPPLARQQRLAALKAKPEGQRSEDEQAELKWLTDKGSALDGRFKSDPLGFAMETAPDGQAPPAITDWTPQEIAARAQWVRGQGKAYGSMEPITAAEADALHQRAAGGDKGYREVLSTLSQFGGKLAVQAARKALPDDSFAQQLVALHPTVMALALDGRAGIRESADFKAARDDDEIEAIEVAQRQFHTALEGVPATQRAAIIEVATNIAAGKAYRKGLKKSVTEPLFRIALDMALGSSGTGLAKKGGLSDWGGQPFLLADGVTRGGFGKQVMNWAKAHPDRVPLNPDGSPMDLRRARPVWIGGVDGRGYAFYVGNVAVKDRNGKIFTLKVNPE